MAPRAVAIVPHTHWDREWYAPFQTFRLRLVELLDGFLPQLEEDLSYARFLLDGQMAVVDDYLEVRPEAEALLRRLAASGRLAMGPWYTLPDEFLVSGETHIRNLQMGLARAAAFGGAMDVGYLPDMFGHIAQMPQLLSQFGFGHAVVWRGVPAAIDRTAFWWTAPDGTTIRAQYLARGGYGNGAAIPDDAKALVRRVAAHEAELGSLLAGGLLFLNGTDHQVPQRWLGRVVAEANAIQDDYRFVVTSLGEYLNGPDAATEGLPSWTGELRSGARANLLMGVASNRVDTKQHAARAERALEQLAEPLCALFLAPERWPASLLDIAWREVVRNAAHDSICACSNDEVVAAVNHRYAEARQIAEGLSAMALRELASTMAAEGPVVVNPSAWPRSGVVEIVVAHDMAIEGTQVLEAASGTPAASRRVRSSDVAALLGQIRGQRFDDTFFVTALALEEDGPERDRPEPEVVVHLATVPPVDSTVEETRRDLYARLGASNREWYRLRIHRPPVQRLLARVGPIAGYGWQAWSSEVCPAGAVSVEGTTMDNGTTTVTVDLHSGTFAVNGVSGLGRLVDGGDAGDTYNYCPPGHDLVVDEPESVVVEVVEAGPVRSILELICTYRWPERLDDVSSQRVGSRTTEVRTRLELHAGQDLVRVSTRFHNQSRDHRLRALFPLPRPATTSHAECAFAVVERGLQAEGGASETPLATYPSRRFVSAGGLTVVHEGLLEYELVDEGHALALTLLRSTGWLSRGPMPTRPEPAGPELPLEAPQLLGPVDVRYGLHVGEGDPYRLVDEAFLPLQVVTSAGGGWRPPSGSALEIDGAQVSALRQTSGGLEVRVFNPTPARTTVRVAGRRGWLVDLRGRPLEPFEETFPLGPWRIATARLAP
ncbi:MAG: alpha-mannosidase [Actinobacteria bacterium]|nr:alpha-mannosidase [Actinomycetota bacterium]